jgi:hypothetical protein
MMNAVYFHPSMKRVSATFLIQEARWLWKNKAIES